MLIKSLKSKEQIFKDGFNLFIKGDIPSEYFNGYMNGDEKSTSNLQEWIVNNLKDEIEDWCTGIDVIESIEQLYLTSSENGNIYL